MKKFTKIKQKQIIKKRYTAIPGVINFFWKKRKQK